MPSLRKPKMRGIKAPPPNEATTRDDPTLVKRPRSVIASGQMAGFIREHASAMKATHQMETFGGVRTISSDPETATQQQILSAWTWETNLGMNKIPRT